MVIGIYINNILLIGPNKDANKYTKDLLKKRFDIKDLGKAISIIGIRITRSKDRKTLSINQLVYAAEVVEDYLYKDALPLPILMELGTIIKL